jgi:hypothetical protein
VKTLTIPTFHRGKRDFGTGYHMMTRIEKLEATIVEALRSRDEEMREVLRKGLHGEDAK